MVSGVRSSCEALATKRRWLSKDAIEPFEHRIEGIGEILDLVLGTGEGDALMEAAVGDAARGGGDLAERLEGLAGHQPADDSGNDGEDADEHERDHQHGIERVEPRLPDLHADALGLVHQVARRQCSRRSQLTLGGRGVVAYEPDAELPVEHHAEIEIDGDDQRSAGDEEGAGIEQAQPGADGPGEAEDLHLRR